MLTAAYPEAAINIVHPVALEVYLLNRCVCQSKVTRMAGGEIVGYARGTVLKQSSSRSCSSLPSVFRIIIELLMLFRHTSRPLGGTCVGYLFATYSSDGKSQRISFTHVNHCSLSSAVSHPNKKPEQADGALSLPLPPLAPPFVLRVTTLKQ